MRVGPLGGGKGLLLHPLTTRSSVPPATAASKEPHPAGSLSPDFQLQSYVSR